MDNLRIEKVTIGYVSTNCYLAYHKDTKETIIIDPADHGEPILDKIKTLGLKPAAIFLTHGHFDHIMSVPLIKESYNISVYAHEAEQEILEDAEKNASLAFLRRGFTVKADEFFTDNQEVVIAGFRVKVIHTPGHTIGGVCYYVEDEGVLFCGDTLFADSYGRTDLPTGSEAALMRSLREKLFVLPDDVMAYPGHGEATSVGYEKQYNPAAF